MFRANQVKRISLRLQEMVPTFINKSHVFYAHIMHPAEIQKQEIISE